MLFSPFDYSIDMIDGFSYGSLIKTPLDPGVWAIFQASGLQNHAPQLCWVNNNLLACVWMAGGQEGTAGMSIMISLLSANCSSWSEPQLISQDVSRSEQNPLLFVNGTALHLIHTAQLSRDLSQSVGSDDSFSMQWTAKLRFQSLDISNIDVSDPKTWGPLSWSKSFDLIDEPSFCRNPPFRRSDGCWMLPIYRSLEEGGAFGHDHSQLLILSSFSAHTSPESQVVDIPESIGRIHGSIVPSKSRTYLLQFFRSRLADRIYCSRSDLLGLNWSRPEPIDLPNNNSSIQACRLSSGRLAIIYNRFCFEPDHRHPQEWGDANWPRTRWPLSIALSEDDGLTWPYIRDVDTGFGFCGSANWTLNGQLAYPSLLEGCPGELHIAYSWAGRKAIRYVCLHEHDIIGFIPE